MKLKDYKKLIASIPDKYDDFQVCAASEDQYCAAWEFDGWETYKMNYSINVINVGEISAYEEPQGLIERYLIKQE